MDNYGTLGWKRLCTSVTCETGWEFPWWIALGCTGTLNWAVLRSSTQLAGCSPRVWPWGLADLSVDSLFSTPLIYILILLFLFLCLLWILFAPWFLISWGGYLDFWFYISFPFQYIPSSVVRFTIDTVLVTYYKFWWVGFPFSFSSRCFKVTWFFFLIHVLFRILLCNLQFIWNFPLSLYSWFLMSFNLNSRVLMIYFLLLKVI